MHLESLESIQPPFRPLFQQVYGYVMDEYRYFPDYLMPNPSRIENEALDLFLYLMGKEVDPDFSLPMKNTNRWEEKTGARGAQRFKQLLERAQPPNTKNRSRIE